MDDTSSARPPERRVLRLEQGRFGPIFPKTPACYGFSVIAKVKPGREQAIRDYGKTIQEAVKGDPHVLAPLKLHYLRWVLFDVGSGMHFMYQGIFDTDFDKYPRGRSGALHQDRDHDSVCQPRRMAGGLEDEPDSGDQVLS